jgi:DNA polymerase III epsilon subunit-like protein
MTWFSVDIEANGPAPGLFSMTSIGMVAVRGDLDDTFYAELKPLVGAGCLPAALEVGGMTMEYLHEHGREPGQVMVELAEWLEATSNGRPVFVADNPGFDFGFVTYYFAMLGMANPFGHSARRIGDMYSGLVGDSFKASEWKSLRTTAHTHNALDDAVGNAQALLAIKEQGLKIPSK